MVSAAHPWKLVGPWYRWQHAALPSHGRSSRPALQKFSGAEFVKDFTAKPQHSLSFDPLLDVVTEFDQISAKVPGKQLAGKLSALFPVDASGKPLNRPKAGASAFRSRLAPSSLRKLFLPAHDRHYLTVCELHCDVPGFPSVPRREVCQAAFVVRRRRVDVPAGARSAVIAEAAKVTKLEADLGELLALQEEAQRRTLTAAARAALKARCEQLAAAASLADFAALLASATSAVEQQRRALQGVYAKHQVRTIVDGWFPRVVDGLPSNTAGFWRELTSEEQERDPALGVAEAGSTGSVMLTESTFGLYPLVPDPRDADHDAAGRTIFFGVVPTSSSSHDEVGAPRFDSNTTLEIRCFVRRHHACPARRGKSPDCHGEVVWSPPTEAYRLAAPFDVIGASLRPITIQMPDLRELAAQVARRPRGTLSPVRVVQPQHMSPVPKEGAPGGNMEGPAICFFSIPLITIVAMFVLNLFLPIVVFVFQLWFLLVLRFCIKPQISLGLGVDAALDIQPPGIDLDLDAGVRIGSTSYTAQSLHDALKADLKAQIVAELGELDAGDIDAGLELHSNSALAALAQSNNDNARMPSNPELPPPELAYATELEYEPHREPEWQPSGGRG